MTDGFRFSVEMLGASLHSLGAGEGGYFQIKRAGSLYLMNLMGGGEEGA